MREVAEVLVLDLAALAVGPAKEVCPVDLALVAPNRGGYMNRTVSAWHADILRIMNGMSSGKR